MLGEKSLTNKEIGINTIVQTENLLTLRQTNINREKEKISNASNAASK